MAQVEIQNIFKNDYKNVVLKGDWNEEELKQNYTKKTYPICGYPLQLRYNKAYGLRLFMCTNEQELCGFMTNDMKAGKLSIMKCDKCRDGYLIAKSSENGYFLGCTNYKNNKTGCNNSIGTNEYLTLMNFKPDFEKTFASNVRNITTNESNDKPTKQIVNEKNILSNHNIEKRTKQNIIDDKHHQEKIDIKDTISNVPAEKPVMISKIETDLNYKGYNLYNLLKQVISCLEHISKDYFFGITILINVLRGESNKKIEKHKLNEVPEYSMFMSMSRDEMQAVIQWMINNHYMLKTKPNYPVLHSSYNGIHFDECITKKQLKNLKKYLEDTNREIFEDDDIAEYKQEIEIK